LVGKPRIKASPISFQSHLVFVCGTAIQVKITFCLNCPVMPRHLYEYLL